MRRLFTYPTRATKGAVMGVNMQSTFNTLAQRQDAASIGVKHFRTQFGWETTEDYTTGVLSLSPTQEASLAWCGANGIGVNLVAGYGPPATDLVQLTVATQANSGSTTIDVTGSTTTAIDFPYCHVRKSNGAMIVAFGKWSYQGALIASKTSTSITLAAALNTTLTVGTVLQVRRLRYPSIKTDTDPQWENFADYCEFLAERIAANGATGWVNIWNEWSWANDPWPNRSYFYDSIPGDVTVTNSLWGGLMAVKGRTFPDGVSAINGSTDVTGFQTLYGVYESGGTGFNGVSSDGEDVGPFTHEGMHPYGGYPESAMWQEGEPDNLFGYYDDWFKSNDPYQYTSNFRNLAGRQYKGQHLKGALTETGQFTSNDGKHSLSIIRRCLVAWAMDLHISIYAWEEGNIFGIKSSGVPRPAYYALGRLNDLISTIGLTTDDNLVAPTCSLLGVGNNLQWPLYVTSFSGLTGGLFCVWQGTRPRYPAEDWIAMSAPTAVTIKVLKPQGSAISSITLPVEGTDVTYGIDGNVISIPVSDSPVCIMTEVT